MFIWILVFAQYIHIYYICFFIFVCPRVGVISRFAMICDTIVDLNLSSVRHEYICTGDRYRSTLLSGSPSSIHDAISRQWSRSAGAHLHRARHPCLHLGFDAGMGLRLCLTQILELSRRCPGVICERDARC